MSLRSHSMQGQLSATILKDIRSHVRQVGFKLSARHHTKNDNSWLSYKTRPASWCLRILQVVSLIQSERPNYLLQKTQLTPPPPPQLQHLVIEMSCKLSGAFWTDQLLNPFTWAMWPTLGQWRVCLLLAVSF